MTTTVTGDGDVAVLRMGEPRANALSTATLTALHQALDEVEASGPRAAVIVGTGRVFCVGLDLKECTALDEAALAVFVDAFEGFFERLFAFPIPVVAAVNGHAIAGGAVLAYACDVRVMSAGAEIGLNEVELGIPFPSMAFEVGRFAVPSASHVDALMLGRRFPAAEALARGLVHEVVDAAEVESSALVRARAFTERGHDAVVATKRMLRAEHLARARANATSSRAAFIRAFLAPEARARIGALVEKLSAGRGR